jgi:hypothetical protein
LGYSEVVKHILHFENNKARGVRGTYEIRNDEGNFRFPFALHICPTSRKRFHLAAQFGSKLDALNYADDVDNYEQSCHVVDK